MRRLQGTLTVRTGPAGSAGGASASGRPAVLHQRRERVLGLGGPALRPREEERRERLRLERRALEQRERRLGCGDEKVDRAALQPAHGARGTMRHLYPRPLGPLECLRRRVGHRAPLVQFGGGAEEQAPPVAAEGAQHATEDGSGVRGSGGRRDDEIVATGCGRRDVAQVFQVRHPPSIKVRLHRAKVAAAG
jgi:hypothetical protein